MSESDAYFVNTLLKQIGSHNIIAISGGRVGRVYRGEHLVGVELPVSNGYHVEVTLDADDTYRVRRVFTRAGKIFPKGTESGIYVDQVGDAAYRASCFRSEKFGGSISFKGFTD